MLLAVALVAGMAARVGDREGGAASFPRDETLYVSATNGGSPTNFNPLDPGQAYTGAQGLLYEPLFLFDPVRGKFLPWLATAGSWSGPSTYELQVRTGVDWVSSAHGQVVGRLSGADVAYSIELAARNASDPFHADAASVQGVTVRGSAVTVRFRAPVGYAPWQEFLWRAPIVPSAEWSRLAAPAVFGGANNAPVATGPMELASTSSHEVCYRDNPHWWGSSQLRLSFKFDYLCAVAAGPSGDELSALLAGRTDWSNELLRGIPDLASNRSGGYDITTYYPGPPYMLPAATAWLEMDTARSPMASVNFRRAVAFALDPKAIASTVYSGAVTAAGPTGLLPALAPFVDKSVVDKDGFYHSTSMAKKLLARSGYQGQRLTIDVPEGWTDEIDAATAISHQLAVVGVHLEPVVEPLATEHAEVADGSFDMVIANGPEPSPTPWTYFNAVYRLPITAQQPAGLNEERYSGPATWALVRQAAATPLSDSKALDDVYARLEASFLEQLPEIPLWYSGAWFQANTSYWEGYPSSTEADDQYTPVMWPGWLGSMTTVYALAGLKAHRS
jgi:peptide/nickel transport system substrate-binding protein